MQPQITHFNLHLPVDVRCVSEAARVLCVRDIDLFKLAYQWWCQREPSESTLDKVFSDYLLNETVPFWVRHYCRNVLKLDSVGQLDPRDFGVEEPPISGFTIKEQRYAALITLLGFFVYILFI